MNITRTIALIIAVALMAALILTVGPMACNALRSKGAQIRLNEGQNDALANSAADAVSTQGAATKREARSEDLTRSNEKEIRNAPGASDPVNPLARDAGLASLCRRAAYRDSERCRLLPAAPK